MQLFQVYNISLGNDEQEREVIIMAIQKLNRNQFDTLLKSLHNTNNVTDSHTIQLRDITQIVQNENVEQIDINRDNHLVL